MNVQTRNNVVSFAARFILVLCHKAVRLGHRGRLLCLPVAAREGLSRDYLFIPKVEFQKVTKPHLRPLHALKRRYCLGAQRMGEL